MSIVRKKWYEDNDHPLLGTKMSEETKKKISDTISSKGICSGERNPMYGRSAVRENNLKWYTDGVNTIYVTENTQPEGYRRGRTFPRKIK